MDERRAIVSARSAGIAALESELRNRDGTNIEGLPPIQRFRFKDACTDYKTTDGQHRRHTAVPSVQGLRLRRVYVPCLLPPVRGNGGACSQRRANRRPAC